VGLRGRLPPETFVTETGLQFDPFDILLSFHAIEQNALFGQPVQLGGYAFPNTDRRLGSGLLSAVLVRVANVMAFCERTRTIPPPSLLSGWRRMWAVCRRGWHRSPPPCPALAREFDTRVNQIVAVNVLRRLAATVASLKNHSPGDSFSPWNADGSIDLDELAAIRQRISRSRRSRRSAWRPRSCGGCWTAYWRNGRPSSRRRPSCRRNCVEPRQRRWVA